jgi:6-O-methylguanine DNA methyltransferase-like protein
MSAQECPAPSPAEAPVLGEEGWRNPSTTPTRRPGRWSFEPRPSVPAVGLANERNPVSIIVPCHRVVGSDGSLTGYGGGLDNKQRLLELERRVSRDPAG